jgi:hypothetical protein
MFVHMVLFWCKPEIDADAQAEMIRYAREQMPNIPSVRHVWAGHAVASPRPVVDSSYSFALCVAFDDQAGHDAYQTHPIHQQFVTRFKDRWASIKVVDFQ